MRRSSDYYGPLLDEQVDEARLARNLRAVRRRQTQRRIVRARAVASGLTVALCVCATLLYVRLSGSSQHGPLVVSHQKARCASGADCGTSALHFSDGSQIVLGERAGFELLENDGQRVRGVLHSGWARVSVTPGGPRRWLVDAGGLEVEVVGTSFTVARSGDAARVRVHHGRVLVRGREVPNAPVLLGAQQELRVGPFVRSVAPRLAAPLATPWVPTTQGEVSTAEVHRSATVVERDQPTPHTRATLGQQALERADALRLSGDASRARTVLRAALRRLAGDPYEGVVAFTLGQLELDADAARAEAAFARALASRSLPASLREQAMAKRVEALAKAGHKSEACAAREQYDRTFPEGRWRQAADTWCGAE